METESYQTEYRDRHLHGGSGPRSWEGSERRLHPRKRIGRKLVISFVALAMLVVGGSGWVLYERALDSLESQMSRHLMAEARLLANAIGDTQVLIAMRPGHEGFTFYRNFKARIQKAKELAGARRIFVFDRDCKSLLDTEPGTSIGRVYPELKYRDRMEIERVWQGVDAATIRFKDENGIDYMTGYAPIFISDEVVAAVGLDIGTGFTSAIRGFKRSVYFLAGISALLTLIVGLGMARTITRPIKRLVTAAREIGRGNLQKSVESSADDEIGYLGETMEEMRQRLLARDAQLRQMLAGVAHEIRNPLGGIEIYAGLIADDLPDEDERKKHIQKVIEEVRTLNMIISEFLEFARPLAAEPVNLPVSQLVEDAAFLLSPEMERAGIAYVQNVDPELTAYVDPEQMKRAIFNLMKNAVQAMDDGGRITIKAAAAGSAVVRIDVVDNGRGIDAAVRGRLFEPFFTTREKGSGLGLAIVQQAVETNRGRLHLSSVPGEGTTVSLHLPSKRIGASADDAASLVEPATSLGAG